MALKGFEDRLERMVEGAFARAFKSGLQPVELGRKLSREVERGQALDVHGHPIAPNSFQFRLGPADFEKFSQAEDSLRNELVATVRQKAADEGLGFLGGVDVRFRCDEKLREGVFQLDSWFDESIKVTAPPAWLALPDGGRVDVAADVTKIGRAPDSHVVLADSSASRQHAEIQVVDGDYVLVDLGSTNGSRVNGTAIQRQSLVDGDRLTLGSISLTFRMS